MAHLSTLIAGVSLLFFCPPYASGQDGQNATADTTAANADQEQTPASGGLFPGKPIDIGGLMTSWPMFGGGFGPLGGGMRPWPSINLPPMPINGGGILPGWPTGETTGSTDTAETATVSGSQAVNARHVVSRRRGGSGEAAHSHSRAARGRNRGRGRRARGRRG